MHLKKRKQDGQIPRGGLGSAYLFLLHEVEEKAAWRLLTPPLLNVAQLISRNPTDVTNEFSLGEGKGQERRGEMKLPSSLNTCSSKCGPWTSSISIT